VSVTESRSFESPTFLQLLLAFAWALAGYFILHRGHLDPFLFSDAHVYANALSSWVSGQNAYDAHFGALRFLYPPIFLYVAGPLANVFPAHWGWILYLAIDLACTLALPIVLARFYFKQSWLNALFALLLFLAAPQFGGVLALASGNLACVLYLLVFLAALPGLGKNRWAWFYAAVFLVSLIKINLLLMLALPILAGKRQTIRSSACALVTIAAYLLQKILVPGLYEGYKSSLRYELFEAHQYGYGVFGIVADTNYKFHHTIGRSPYWITGVFVLLLFSGLLLLRRRLPLDGLKRDRTDGIWLTLIIVAIVLANPRLLHYDACVAMPAAFVLITNLLRFRRPILVFAALFLVSLLAAFFVHSTPLKGSLETAGLLAAFTATFFKLWSETSTQHQLEAVRATSAVS